MSRLTFVSQDRAQATVDSLYLDLERRLIASPPGQCPVDIVGSFLKLCHAQTCGKCIPCRVGLGQLENLIDDVTEGRATMHTIDLIEETAESIYLSADCAIGYEAAEIVLRAVRGYRDEFVSHVQTGRCHSESFEAVPCNGKCPANVDIPGYIALTGAGRYDDAVRLIRKDNPLPVACGLICEHPCEIHCRRAMLDQPINIRGIKRYATVKAGKVPVPKAGPATGKHVCIIGGGPSGLTAAYFLALMGHEITIYEQRKQLGGMLRYGIPSYRLPREELNGEIEDILSTGNIHVFTETSVGKDVSLDEIREKFDAVYIAIGAHTDKKVGLEHEDAEGVISAVEMLRGIGDDIMPDYTGKKVVVIGGGNVAMDVARSSIRLGADVTIAYRRRREDMPAQVEEVNGAAEEGCEILDLAAPVGIEVDENNKVTGLRVKQQIISNVRRGRPAPKDSSLDEYVIPADIIAVAIGQNIEFQLYQESGLPIHWGTLQAEEWAGFKDFPGIFSGGDCVFGPATAIKAIAAGKVAAANIDEYLGFDHKIESGVEVPAADPHDRIPCGRIVMKERPVAERRDDFTLMEQVMTDEEAAQECSRCLRCDHYGYGAFRGGRSKRW